MNKKFNTGEKCEVSGQYQVNSSNLEITMVKDKKFPPSNGKSATYTLVDSTKHKKK